MYKELLKQHEEILKKLTDKASKETDFGERGQFINLQKMINNELDAIKSNIDPSYDTFITIRINRFDTTESKDASENDLNDAKFDYVVENRGTLEEYLNKIKQIINEELLK